MIKPPPLSTLRPLLSLFRSQIRPPTSHPHPLLRRAPIRHPPTSQPIRHNSSTTPTAQGQDQDRDQDQPAYNLTFTCRPCGRRSTHRVTKQAYHGGSVLITCPGCSGRHVIADHLKIFGETARSLEDILEESGEVIKTARVTPEGDIEILPPVEGEAKAEEGVEGNVETTPPSS